MKENEAPEKIYISKELVRWSFNEPQSKTDIEYIRADAFIEKACDAYCKVCKIPNCSRNECNYYANFKKVQ